MRRLTPSWKSLKKGDIVRILNNETKQFILDKQIKQTECITWNDLTYEMMSTLPLKEVYEDGVVLVHI